MFNILASILLTGLILTVLATFLFTGPAPRSSRLRWGAVLLLWLAALVGLAAGGVFSVSSGGTLAVGLAVVIPLIAATFAFRYSDSLRELVNGLPLSTLILAHSGRLLGIFFLILYAKGRLPATFALAAGWGDIAIALLAIVLGLSVYRRSAAGWMVGLWNAFGLIDLVLAVILGVGSAADSPLRFIFEAASTGTMSVLPWVLIPGFLVPVYLMTHIVIFGRLVSSALSVGRHSQLNQLAGANH